MSDGGVYERTLTGQAQMGGWRLKGNVIAVSKHLENNHRKWKQDLLGERPGGQSLSCWVEGGSSESWLSPDWKDLSSESRAP